MHVSPHQESEERTGARAERRREDGGCYRYVDLASDEEVSPATYRARYMQGLRGTEGEMEGQVEEEARGAVLEEEGEGKMEAEASDVAAGPVVVAEEAAPVPEQEQEEAGEGEQNLYSGSTAAAEDDKVLEEEAAVSVPASEEAERGANGGGVMQAVQSASGVEEASVEEMLPIAADFAIVGGVLEPESEPVGAGERGVDEATAPAEGEAPPLPIAADEGMEGENGPSVSEDGAAEAVAVVDESLSPLPATPGPASGQGLPEEEEAVSPAAAEQEEDEEEETDNGLAALLADDDDGDGGGSDISHHGPFSPFSASSSAATASPMDVSAVLRTPYSAAPTTARRSSISVISSGLRRLHLGLGEEEKEVEEGVLPPAFVAIAAEEKGGLEEEEAAGIAFAALDACGDDEGLAQRQQLVEEEQAPPSSPAAVPTATLAQADHDEDKEGAGAGELSALQAAAEARLHAAIDQALCRYHHDVCAPHAALVARRKRLWQQGQGRG